MERSRNSSTGRRRVGDPVWWCAVFVAAIAGVALIRLGLDGLGWALLLIAFGMGMIRGPST